MASGDFDQVKKVTTLFCAPAATLFWSKSNHFKQLSEKYLKTLAVDQNFGSPLVSQMSECG